MEVLAYIGAISLAFLFFVFMYYACRILRKNHEGDIRVVWYFYSLTVVITHLIGLWAVNTGAINSNGHFEGESGESINTLLEASLNINLSFSIIFTILAVILLPQIFSYFLSGIFGVAVSPRYMSESLSILMWWGVKTFIVVSGVITTIPIFGSILSWESFGFNNVIAWFLLSIAFCLYSFLVLLIYRESEELVEDINKFVPEKLLNVVTYVHGKCTRHSNDKTEPSA